VTGSPLTARRLSVANSRLRWPSRIPDRERRRFEPARGGL